MTTVEAFSDEYPDLTAPYRPDQLQRTLNNAGLYVKGFPWETTEIGRESADYATYLVAAHILEYKRLQMAASSGSMNTVGAGGSTQVPSVSEWWALSVWGSTFQTFSELVKQRAREEMQADENGEYPLAPSHGFALRDETYSDPLILGVNYG